MKKALTVLSLALVVGLFVTSGTTYASEEYKPNREGRSERRQEKLENKASWLGVTVDELVTAFKEGTFKELLESKGLTLEDMFNHMKELAIERMTERGLSDGEIQERLERMKERHENWDENHVPGSFPRQGGMFRGNK